jgi:hypothetical protein
MGRTYSVHEEDEKYLHNLVRKSEERENWNTEVHMGGYY